jgi:hypothetical protein
MINYINDQINYEKLYTDGIRRFAFSTHKSGSTLLFKMLSELNESKQINALSVPNILFDKGIFESDWHSQSELSSIFENHLIWYGFRALPNILQNSFNNLDRVVYLIRDPRDALVSAFFSFSKNYHSHRLPLNENGFKETFISNIDEINEFVLSRVDDHLRKLSEYDQHIPDSAYIIKYENLFYDKFSEMKKIFDYFNLDIDENILFDICKENDIRPEVERLGEHIRLGTPGDHLNKLNSETIGMLNDKFSSFLQKYY